MEFPRPQGFPRDFPESLSQAMLVGTMLVGRLGVLHNVNYLLYDIIEALLVTFGSFPNTIGFLDPLKPTRSKPDCVWKRTEHNEKSFNVNYLLYDITGSLQTNPHPPPLSRPRYDIFSGAAHTERPYGALKICHTGGSVVGVGVEIMVLIII